MVSKSAGPSPGQLRQSKHAGLHLTSQRLHQEKTGRGATTVTCPAVFDSQHVPMQTATTAEDAQIFFAVVGELLATLRKPDCVAGLGAK